MRHIFFYILLKLFVVIVLFIIYGCGSPYVTYPPPSEEFEDAALTVEAGPTSATHLPATRLTLERTIVPSETPKPISTSVPMCYVDTGIPHGTLNLRSGPGLDYETAGVVNQGDALRTSGEEQAGWIKVETLSGLAGWVNKEYCQGETNG